MWLRGECIFQHIRQYTNLSLFFPLPQCNAIVFSINRFLKSPQLDEFRDIYMPSTGALMLLTALHTCDQVRLETWNLKTAFDILISKLLLQVLLNKCCGCWLLSQVSAYGFMTDNYMNFSDHYYDKVMKPLIFYANHDMKMEGRLWKQLHSHKVLWLYQRQEPRKWCPVSEYSVNIWTWEKKTKTGYRTAKMKLPKKYFGFIH